jgi:hypothetical protein
MRRTPPTTHVALEHSYFHPFQSNLMPARRGIAFDGEFDPDPDSDPRIHASTHPRIHGKESTKINRLVLSTIRSPSSLNKPTFLKEFQRPLANR